MTARDPVETPSEAPSLAELRPMLLAEARAPWADDLHICELKYDGFRVLAEVTGKGVALRTRGRDPRRGGVDATRWYPEVVAGLAGLSKDRTVLDGEVCVLDERGHPDFTKVRIRSGRRRWYAGADPVVYVVYDLLVHKGKDIRNQPLEKRRALLARLLSKPRSSVLLCKSMPGSAAPWLFAQVLQLRLEGIVMKRLGSKYVGGEARSDDWVKIKRKGATKGFKRDTDQEPL